MTERELKMLGIYTIGDLAQTDVQILKKRLGKHGETIWHFANGRNADAVTPEPAGKICVQARGTCDKRS